MVVDQVSLNSWHQSARAAYNESGKKKFLNDFAAALASSDPAVYAPPLRQIMRIGQSVGGDRLVVVLGIALKNSAVNAKDERLAEALLDLAATGSRLARETVAEIAKTDSGYVVAQAWYQRLLDNCCYKLDYAVGKDLAAISERVRILKDCGFSLVKDAASPEARIAEIKEAVVSEERHPGYASSRLAWFFVHGTENDRLALRAALREYVDCESDKKATYGENLLSIKTGVVALLDSEISFAKNTKDKSSLTKLTAAQRAFNSFFGGEEQVTIKAPVNQAHLASPADLFRAELAKEAPSLGSLQRHAKEIGISGVVEVLSPLILKAGVTHTAAVKFVAAAPSQEGIKLLGEAASWSLEAASALAEVASYGNGVSASLRKFAFDQFWSVSNVEVIFRNPSRYAGFVSPVGRYQPRGIFRSLDQIGKFISESVVKWANVREALDVLHAFFWAPAIDVKQYAALTKEQTQDFADRHKLLSDVMPPYLCGLTEEQIRGLTFTSSQDVIFYEVVARFKDRMQPGAVLAVADLMVEALPRLSFAPGKLRCMMSLLPFEQQPKYYSAFVANGCWEQLAAGLYDWADEDYRGKYNFAPTLEALTADQLREVKGALSKVVRTLARHDKLDDHHYEGRRRAAEEYADRCLASKQS